MEKEIQIIVIGTSKNDNWFPQAICLAVEKK